MEIVPSKNHPLFQYTKNKFYCCFCLHFFLLKIVQAISSWACYHWRINPTRFRPIQSNEALLSLQINTRDMLTFIIRLIFMFTQFVLYLRFETYIILNPCRFKLVEVLYSNFSHFMAKIYTSWLDAEMQSFYCWLNSVELKVLMKYVCICCHYTM